MTMFNKLKFLIAAVAVIGLMGMAAPASAQDGGFLVPSGTATTNQVMEMQSDGKVRGTSALTAATSVTVGSNGTAVTQILVTSASLTPGPVSAGVCDEQSFSVSGITSADKLLVNQGFAANVSAVLTTARASAGAGTVLMTFCNVTSAAASPEAGTFTFVAIRS